MKKLVLLSVIAAIAMLSAANAAAQSKQRVRFAAGKSSTSIKGSVRGFSYKDYIVKASAGQTISVSLDSPNPYSVFTIFLPGGENLEGGAERGQFEGELPANGDYVIRVGMMRSEARRPRSISNYTLKISIR